VEQDPLLEEAWETLGLALAKQAFGASRNDRERMWRDVEEVYTKAISHDRGYPSHWIGRGMARAKIGQKQHESDGYPLELYRQAEEDLSQALRIEKHAPEAWLWRGFAGLLRASYRGERGQDPLEDYAAAEKHLAEALRLDPGHAEAWWWLGHVHLECGNHRLGHGQDPLKDFEEAEGLFTKVLPFDVEYRRDGMILRAIARAHRGAYLMSQGQDPLSDYALAEEDLTQAVQFDREYYSETWCFRGDVRLWRARYREERGERAHARKDYEGALGDYGEFLRLDPSSTQRHREEDYPSFLKVKKVVKLGSTAEIEEKMREIRKRLGDLDH
jgi:tetratricopeptide (TPR) repeat protein